MCRESSGCVYVDVCWGAQGGKMLSFLMLAFAGSLLMNIAEAILKLKYADMSLETAVDAAFGCVHCLTLGANGFCMPMAAMEILVSEAPAHDEVLRGLPTTDTPDEVLGRDLWGSQCCT
jgi:cytochrome c biogenesis factor